MRRSLLAGLFLLCVYTSAAGLREDAFQNPPAEARPWVYWFWINGNISKTGITADLEALHRTGVGGVLWMEVSGPWWAPDGKVVPLSPQWHEAIQWAFSECQRLGMTFDMTLDFGYGSGGPHIRPEQSMQKLVWTEQTIVGGSSIDLKLQKPQQSIDLSETWLRPGTELNPEVVQMLKESDSYRDVAVLAIPLPETVAAQNYRIPELASKSGLHRAASSTKQDAAGIGQDASSSTDAITPLDSVIDLTGRMDKDGDLKWNAPVGQWIIIRFGHMTNLQMTRPCPAAAVGLECDRLSRTGIDAHFKSFLEPIFKDAGELAGKALAYTHIDSWEAGGQNWTASFPKEFKKRRGYDLRPWLPVLTGRLIGSDEMAQRFLWDVRATAGEMVLDNYATRLRELARPYGIKLSAEAYGGVCADNLSYAGTSDMPISEFWAQGDGKFPELRQGYLNSSKAMASAAHVYGNRPFVGAEAFTSSRGWQDHPYLLKGMGDLIFCEGVNRFIFHLSAHQPYETMVPGLTHRKWGEHFTRFNTWWNYSKPWMDYLARCQYVLQQGQFVADVCYWFGEGAPLHVNDMKLDIPEGYDYDLCSSEIVLQMQVKDGRLTLPSGMSYKYLVLPDTDRMTLPLARKIRQLAQSKAKLIASKRLVGVPGLSGYPKSDNEIESIAAALWDNGQVIMNKSLAEVFAADKLLPDFEGQGLKYLHRRDGQADVYFVSSQQQQPQTIDCTFRVAGKTPELWNPQTGERRVLPQFTIQDGRTIVPLYFEPMQSWFVVFRENHRNSAGGNNFASSRKLRELAGSWQVSFDPKWGGPDSQVIFESLANWSDHNDSRIKYYSGTAVYRTTLDLAKEELAAGRLLLDLGLVEIIAKVKLNGKDCGIAWKPPYSVDISDAARVGTNELEIDVVNLWINRMIGDEQLPEDCDWKNFETLERWPTWFLEGKPRPSGRLTFTTCKHYKKDSPLSASGLLGPVTLKYMERQNIK